MADCEFLEAGTLYCCSVSIGLISEVFSYINITGTDIARKKYNEAICNQSSSQNKKMELAWNFEEFKILRQNLHATIADLTTFHDFLSQSPSPGDTAQFNVPKQLTTIKEQLINLTKGIERKKRKAATHALFILISDEKRDKKPYAVPVQYISYTSLRDRDVRSLVQKVKQEMVSIGMEVVGKMNLHSETKLDYSYNMIIVDIIGLVTDGEFNSLRSKGESRPLSVIEVKAEVRRRVSQYKMKQLKEMLTVKSKFTSYCNICLVAQITTKNTSQLLYYS